MYMTLIINIEKSPLRNRRYRTYLLNGDRYDVGFVKCKYYVDTGDKELRNFYYALMSKEIKQKIISLTPSPLLYETFILNGATKNLIKNINFFNKEILRNF